MNPFKTTWKLALLALAVTLSSGQYARAQIGTTDDLRDQMQHQLKQAEARLNQFDLVVTTADKEIAGVRSEVARIETEIRSGKPTRLHREQLTALAESAELIEAKFEAVDARLPAVEDMLVQVAIQAKKFGFTRIYDSAATLLEFANSLERRVAASMEQTKLVRGEIQRVMSLLPTTK